MKALRTILMFTGFACMCIGAMMLAHAAECIPLRTGLWCIGFIVAFPVLVTVGMLIERKFN